MSSPPSHTDILQHTSPGQQQGTLRTQEALGPSSRRDPLLLPPAHHFQPSVKPQTTSQEMGAGQSRAHPAEVSQAPAFWLGHLDSASGHRVCALRHSFLVLKVGITHPSGNESTPRDFYKDSARICESRTKISTSCTHPAPALSRRTQFPAATGRKEEGKGRREGGPGTKEGRKQASLFGQNGCRG